jgi:hypothetical protein
MEYLLPIMEASKRSSSDMVQMMKASSDSNMQMMMLMMQQQQQSQQAMMQVVIATIAGANNNKSNSFDELMKYKLAFPDSSEKMFQIFKQGMELGGNKEDKPWWQEALIGLAPAVMPALMGQKVAITTPPPQIEQQKPVQDENMLALMKKVQDMANYVETSAQLKVDVKEVATKMIADAESVKFLDKGLEMLDDPLWFEKLKTKSPLAEKYKDSLFKLREEILSRYPLQEVPSADNSPIQAV